MAETVTDRPDAVALSSPANGAEVSVSFQNVTFGYDPGRPVLTITLEVHPGETLALVGATGAGKSSLAALIPRLFDPQDGIVLVDDTDIRTVKLSSLRTLVSVVPQGCLLASDKHRHQHRLWSCRRRRARCRELPARAANADEFIRRLPEGYATVLGERGATLSGGQRQRLAIARALLRDAPDPDSG